MDAITAIHPRRSIRDYLQDKCEPPVYVSDRRFMKAINLLQVAAYADGRDAVCTALPPSLRLPSALPFTP